MIQKRIDTHIHIWDFEQAEYSWLRGDESILNRTYSLAELEPARGEAGITTGILVQAANNFEDTDWMLRIAAESDWIRGVVGWLPLADPAATYAALTGKYGSNPYFKGVRHMIHNEPDPDWLLQDTCIESLKILEAHGCPYDFVGITTAHLETALKLAGKVPGLKMVFDHLNQPPISTGEKYGNWGELMKEASGHKQFFAKISGLGTTAGKLDATLSRRLEPYIDFVFQHFTEDRCFCGGDWPVSLLAGNYSQTWQVYAEVISRLLDKTGQEKVFYQNAERFYDV